MAKKNKYAKEARQARRRRVALLSCESKRRYDTEPDARDDLPADQFVYSCGRCAGWHRATTRTPGEQRRLRRGHGDVASGE